MGPGRPTSAHPEHRAGLTWPGLHSAPPRPVTHERGSRETVTLSKDPRSRADPERASRCSCISRVPMAGRHDPPQRRARRPHGSPLPPTLSASQSLFCA